VATEVATAVAKQEVERHKNRKCVVCGQAAFSKLCSDECRKRRHAKQQAVSVAKKTAPLAVGLSMTDTIARW